MITNKLFLFLTLIVNFYALLVSTTYSQNEISLKNLSFDKYLTGYSYPFKLHKYKFQSQGKDLEMTYMYLPGSNLDMGLITLLHGKNFNGAYWKETAKLLQSMGYGVLIPDQIGFGKSSKPLNYQYSFEALALNTKNLLEYLDIQSTQIIAHSMGGMLASRFALLYPDKTNSIILVNPIGLENYLNYVEYKDINFFYRNELKIKPQNIIDYQKKNYYDGAWNDKYESLTIPLIGWLNGNDWSILAKVSAQTYDMIFTGAVIGDFKKFQMPVSLILGTRDRTGPGRNWKKSGIDYELGRYDKLGKTVKKYNPKINVIELNGLGHLPQIENFNRYRKAVEAALIFNN